MGTPGEPNIPRERLRNRFPANGGFQTPSEPPSPGVLQPRCPQIHPYHGSINNDSVCLRARRLQTKGKFYATNELALTTTAELTVTKPVARQACGSRSTNKQQRALIFGRTDEQIDAAVRRLVLPGRRLEWQIGLER